MDYENEKLLKLIFPNGVPEHLRENPELLPQIYKLGSCKVDQIKKEETRLAEDNISVVGQTQDLAISNYKTFIQTSECSRRIYTEFKETDQQLDHLIDKLPNLADKCEKFIKTSSEIATSRRLNSLTLRRNAQLLEILELPQLMDTCIYQGKYEEALELAAHVQRMGTKHSDIPVINNIVATIEGSWHTMLEQLLGQLRTDLQLPKCLQIVGYLRRMQAFSLPELKLKFLQARDSWFCSILNSIPKDDPQHHLMKTIELSRVNLFNIITQYKATFADDDNSLDSTDAQESGNIFHAWINTKINNFLKTLESDLNHGEITSFESVLGQCMYFGLSFSRVGADFRTLLIPIFVKVIAKNFTSRISKVTQQFEHEMDNYTFINKMSINVLSAIGKSDSNSLAPPETLLNFQPLALYCNGILSALNEFRNCAPIALVNEVTQRLEHSLKVVANNISKFYRQEKQALGAKERDNFVKFCCALAYDLTPYIQRCIHDVFPIALLTTHLSINAIALQKSGISYLNKRKILEPLEYLLPDKVETIVKEVTEQSTTTTTAEKKPETNTNSDEISTPQEASTPQEVS